MILREIERDDVCIWKERDGKSTLIAIEAENNWTSGRDDDANRFIGDDARALR